MDNHADNFIINDNYIAGLIDSDFGVFLTKNMYKGKLMLRPRINFVNTRFKLVDTVSEYLKNNNINHHVSLNKSELHRDYKRLVIGRLIKCVDFVDKFANFSIVRRPQLELLREFCMGRLMNVKDVGWKYNNTPYTEEQKKLYDVIKDLNLNYNRDDNYRNYTYSWLAGMVDGDGSIYFSDTHRKYNGKKGEISYRKIIPYLKITTESHTALNNIIELYTKNNIRYYIDKSRGKLSKQVKKHTFKYYYSIVVKEFDPLLFLLTKLNGKLLAKQKQLDLVYKYINIKKNDRKYTKEVFDIVDKVKYLNHNY